MFNNPSLITNILHITFAGTAAFVISNNNPDCVFTNFFPFPCEKLSFNVLKSIHNAN